MARLAAPLLALSLTIALGTASAEGLAPWAAASARQWKVSSTGSVVAHDGHGNFRTDAPAMNLVSMGDWGQVNNIQRSVAAHIAKAAADLGAHLMLALGDNFYQVGVKSDNDSQWDTTYRDIFNQPSLGIPWLALLGNHDHYGNASAQVTFSTTGKDARWYMPAMWYNYTWSWNNSPSYAKVVVIDTVLLDPDMSLESIMDLPSETRGPLLAAFHNAEAAAARKKLAEEQWTWIAQQLKEADADPLVKWLFVLGHYPVYSGGGHGNSAKLIQDLRPLMNASRVDAYLCGHDHTLQYLQDVTPNGVVHHYVSGNAAKTDGKYKPVADKSVWGTLANGYTTHELSDDAFVTRYWSSTGSPLYSVTQNPRRKAHSSL